MTPTEQSFMADYLGQSVQAMADFAADAALQASLGAMADRVAASLGAGGKLLLCGNGGSAADAQHLACEFVVRMTYNRRALAAIALTTDTSTLTALPNDYGFDYLFARQVEALGNQGDVLLGISTSGNSPNVLGALAAARARGMLTLGFTGAGGGKMAEACDLLFRAPSKTTAVIQQVHITAGHLLCSLVERQIAPPEA